MLLEAWEIVHLELYHWEAVIVNLTENMVIFNVIFKFYLVTKNESI